MAAWLPPVPAWLPASPLPAGLLACPAASLQAWLARPRAATRAPPAFPAAFPLPARRRCVTDWQTLEAGEKRYLAATASDYWTYGAHIAGGWLAGLGGRPRARPVAAGNLPWPSPWRQWR